MNKADYEKLVEVAGKEILEFAEWYHRYTELGHIPSWQVVLGATLMSHAKKILSHPNLAWIEEDQLCSVCASEKTHRNGCPYRRWMRVTQLNKMEGEDEIS